MWAGWYTYTMEYVGAGIMTEAVCVMGQCL